MKLSVKTFVGLSTAAIILAACASNEIGDSKDVAQDKIYQGYDISYSEGDAQAEVFCQFRFAGKNGTTLVLNSPSQVQLDGEKITVDSSGSSGAFYRTYKTANAFYGTHHLSFFTTDNKKLDNSFSFGSFKLAAVPPAVSKKQNLVLHFDGAPLQAGDYIEISTSGTDSSFTVTSGSDDKLNTVTIPAKELKRQKGNELTLDATVYQTIPLKESTAEGGRISITYQLKPFKVILAR
ncbi:MAG: hypothetical protein JST86_16925 [Bacteroidetes bacterium]|nr:hypothetical protein [Bacteroidota bacterium]